MYRKAFKVLLVICKCVPSCQHHLTDITHKLRHCAAQSFSVARLRTRNPSGRIIAHVFAGAIPRPHDDCARNTFHLIYRGTDP